MEDAPTPFRSENFDLLQVPPFRARLGLGLGLGLGLELG